MKPQPLAPGARVVKVCPMMSGPYPYRYTKPAGDYAPLTTIHAARTHTQSCVGSRCAFWRPQETLDLKTGEAMPTGRGNCGLAPHASNFDDPADPAEPEDT